LVVPKDLVDRLYRHFKTEAGDPSYSAPTLTVGLRMFYLSATTIATLGLGDITPVSTCARVAVGIEAVFGIIILGGFVNAVTKRRGCQEVDAGSA
jgi:Ion channel